MGTLNVSRECFLMSRRLGHLTPRMSPGLGFAVPSSFISLREITQSSALQTTVECKQRAPIPSAQEAAGVSRSEIKEEPKAGDIRGGSRPLTLGSGTNDKAIASRSTIWAN